MKILVTGGLGYIGSHVVVELLNNNHDVVIINSLHKTKLSVLDKIKQITGKEPKFYWGDVCDKNLLEKIIVDEQIEVVFHLAGHKAVRESCENPLKYYHNNLMGAINLLEVMQELDVKKLIFSSSATVYGERDVKEYTEEMGRGETTSPYGTTKAMIEKILEDLYKSDKEWSISVLRYFNPIGAHESGLIGENPKGIPNNLMPYLMKVATGEIEKISIFGYDYPTEDGTCVRDYIHVVDLAKGHIAALNQINQNGVHIYNLSTGKGTTVLQLIQAFEQANDVKINYELTDRRGGDLGEVRGNPDKAFKELGWKAEKGLVEMCKDAWNFKTKNTE